MRVRSVCTRTYSTSSFTPSHVPIRAAHDLADLASPECATGSIPYVARWYIQAYLPLFVILVLYLVTRCGLLMRERARIMIMWLVQLAFIFGDYGSGSTNFPLLYKILPTWYSRPPTFNPHYYPHHPRHPPNPTTSSRQPC